MDTRKFSIRKSWTMCFILLIALNFHHHTALAQLTSILGTSGFLGSHRITQNRQAATTGSSIFYNTSLTPRPSLILDSSSNVTSLTDLEDPLYCGALTWNYGWIAVATNAFASCEYECFSCL